jgi:hypothetical protein
MSGKHASAARAAQDSGPGGTARRDPRDMSARERQRRVSALEAERKAARCPIWWQFTSSNARARLEHLYPIKQA